ncbi:serine/threonine-protein kinase [Luteitalea sp. TBR-22]|uniref:serine/threonine-protein kinase n=1 Tax=Luteitalea sp. TBR-22 TaxID=2802971 RepID=UPI00272E5EF2|nr:serine/threonine-protein kinase [Luteitalea sp. TBR-22]
MRGADLHARAKAIFLEAQQREPLERHAFVRDACAADDRLRDEVESLLQYAAEPTDIGGASAPTSAAPLRAGELFAGRFRIIELLGRGGMGEVYRVTDELMRVDVALKRLRPDVHGEHGGLLGEVRLARQVTHPAVCRVHDIGRADGQFYLTMEYVDGEDLATLLHRIGRLPIAKAIDIARQACAGLAAAHAAGIVHRDLKPANLMLDRQGNVRITDFGIAVEAAEDDGLLAGTPAYMAPEQLAGRPATPRSDLFALAVVLYEAIAGVHPFGLASRTGPPPPMRAHVPHVAPALDRALLAALAEDPEARPASALAFAASLPGVDALQVALAAGQVPSVHLVASAGTEGRMGSRASVGLVAIGVAGIVTILATSQARVVDRVQMPEQPAVLAASARQLLREVAGNALPPHGAHRVMADEQYISSVPARALPHADGTRLASVVYRESRAPLAPSYELDAVEPFALTPTNPPLREPGDAAVVMDGLGRLVSLQVAPRRAGVAPVDWTPVLRAAGIDLASVRGDAPVRTSAATWSARLVTGGAPVRVDARATGGQVASFVVTRQGFVPGAVAGGSIAADVLAMIFCLVVLPLVCLRAWTNLQSGRSDWRSAGRITVVLFVCTLTAVLLGATYMAPRLELQRMALMASWQLLLSLLTAAFYAAFEPFVRRRWPWSLIAWSRLLAGRVRDPLVGRDALIGLVAALASTAVYQVLIAADVGLTGARPAAFAYAVLAGPRHMLAALIAAVPQALTAGMLLVLSFSAVVGALRRPGLASLVLVATFVGVNALLADTSIPEFIAQAIAFALLVWLFVRFGLVTVVTYMFGYVCTNAYPLSLATSWRGELAMVTIAALAFLLIVTAASATRHQVGAAALRPTA